jgi:aspartyl-tRNA(Asn)/glutamyl-tRNA(Gln) amidotransferase subunit B
MDSAYEPVIGLEVHAELLTRSKMFCSCPVVDLVEAPPNTAVCPVCAGMPGVLPVVNRKAVEYALRVALALDCSVAPVSFFARKNYFYPDLPKGYQISQYEYPLARHGRLQIPIPSGEKTIRIRRVHLEEDTGKLTHVQEEDEEYSLVDLNRAGIPLLEIVTEPDMHSPDEVRIFAQALRSVLRYLSVNSGDLQKGVMRVEPNVSVRPRGSEQLGTRVEIKNLNSFRALERSVAYEIERQIALLERGENVVQQTVGWDEVHEATFTQRIKETEDDYRYFPEPDLPPLVIDEAWIEDVRKGLPELPAAKARRLQRDYGLTGYDAQVLIDDQAVADYFEASCAAEPTVPPKYVVNWISGALFNLLNQRGLDINQTPVTPAEFGALVRLVSEGALNQNTAKAVLAEMFESGASVLEIVAARDLGQISDATLINEMVAGVLRAHPQHVAEYLSGKESLLNWLFGQVMLVARGLANPQLVREALVLQLSALRDKHSSH